MAADPRVETSNCAPWYVDVSCPPYSVNPKTMSPAEQRERIQQAWDDVSAAGGGIVVLPDLYTVNQSPGQFFCLRARDNVATWGVDQFSSGLRMAKGAAGSVMLVATGPVNTPGGAVNVSFARLTLDGNKTGTGPDPQRHCLWLQEAVNVLCDQVRFLNAPGDGAYHYNDTRETTFRDCLFVGSGRNGITFTRANHSVKISRCRFRAISAQQIDSEPGPTIVPFDMLVEGCTFERAVGETDFVVSVGGNSGDDPNRTHHWRFIGNRFEGAVNVTWARDIVFSGNEWVIPDETYAKPCLFLNRTTERVAVTGNTFSSTGDCITLQATSGAGQQPRHITIDGNTFVLLQRTGAPVPRSAVNAEAGPGEYVFSNNTVLGPPDETGASLRHRSTRRNKSVIIRGNIVRQCRIGFQLVSAVTDRFERVVLEGNTFDPESLAVSFAVVLDREANVIDDFVMANNLWTGPGVIPVGRDAPLVPYTGSQLWRTNGSAGLQATYSCVESPRNQFDAPVGSLAVRRDGGIQTTLYVKEAATAAGWRAILSRLDSEP